VTPGLAARRAPWVQCGVDPTSAPAIAVLASGQGTNFEALVRAERSGLLRARIVTLLCDTPGAPALARARRLGVEAEVLPGGRFRTRLEDEAPWIAHLRAREVRAVALAGFMRRLHAPFLGAFPDRVLNLHPSLLPAFAGLDPIGRALAHGVRVTGCTVHLVTDEIDGGPIVAQACVDVRDDDDVPALAARIHDAEHALYPRALDRFLHEPWRREGRRIVFASNASAGAAGERG
jgi:phosphoribosylglycinamide formyltransferase 1